MAKKFVYVANFCDKESWGQTCGDPNEAFDAGLEAMATPQFVGVFAKMRKAEVERLKEMAICHLRDLDEDTTLDFEEYAAKFYWADSDWFDRDEAACSPVVSYRNLELWEWEDDGSLVLLLVIQKTELQ